MPNLTSNINSIDFKVGDIDKVLEDLSLAIVEKFFEPTINASNIIGSKKEPLISISEDRFSGFLSGVSDFVINKLQK